MDRRKNGSLIPWLALPVFPFTRREASTPRIRRRSNYSAPLLPPRRLLSRLIRLLAGCTEFPTFDPRESNRVPGNRRAATLNPRIPPFGADTMINPLTATSADGSVPFPGIEMRLVLLRFSVFSSERWRTNGRRRILKYREIMCKGCIRSCEGNGHTI